MSGRPRPPFDPWQDRGDVVEAVLRAREDGATLRQAAAAAGVHVATVCRCAAGSRTFRMALDDAAEFGARAEYLQRIQEPRPDHGRKPSVLWGRDCPACGNHSALGEQRAYIGAGVVLRCPGCDRVTVRIATLRDRHIVHVTGSLTLEVPRS